jgi:hypothetical protein
VTIRLGGDNSRVQLVLRRCSGLHLEFGIDLDVAVIREKKGFLVLWNKGVPTTATWCEAVEWTCSPVGSLCGLKRRVPGQLRRAPQLRNYLCLGRSGPILSRPFC